MAKLYFRFGAMGASKTANALMVKYNYEEKGKQVILCKPALDDRDGATTVHSRIGLESEGVTVEEMLQMRARGAFGGPGRPACIIIDEAQFLTAEQVEELTDIVDHDWIPIICYGLKIDFQSYMFEGSKRLLELADEIEEIPTICWCGKKARFNARLQDGRIVRTGSQIVLGANDKYTALCRRHYLAGMPFGPES